MGARKSISKGGVHSLRRVATFPVPLYDGLVLGVPSLLDVLEHVAEEDYDVLHVATPGPLGLAALVAGVVLSVPVVGAYHTEFGAYARALSGDAFVAEIVDVAVREFYERCSAVAVPSQATALALRNRGYRIRHFEILKNGVDNVLFDPRKRDPALNASLGGGRTLLLYAGRVSREKGLDLLAAGYLSLRRRRDDVHLVVAGDGPYRGELEALLAGSATFTGFLRGEELARLYASCDVFVFPSTTDTLGRAVAEAQASGLPAVVWGVGGPQECIRPGISGLVADAGDEDGFFSAIELLLDDAETREEMGGAAREFAAGMSWEAVLDALITLRSRLARPRPDSNIYAKSRSRLCVAFRSSWTSSASPRPLRLHRRRGQPRVASPPRRPEFRRVEGARRPRVVADLDQDLTGVDFELLDLRLLDLGVVRHPYRVGLVRIGAL